MEVCFRTVRSPKLRWRICWTLYRRQASSSTNRRISLVDINCERSRTEKINPGWRIEYYSKINHEAKTRERTGGNKDRICHARHKVSSEQVRTYRPGAQKARIRRGNMVDVHQRQKVRLVYKITTSESSPPRKTERSRNQHINMKTSKC